MTLKVGELYRCADANCACEVKVTKAPQSENGGNKSPKCCCGKDMQRVANQ